MASAVPSKKDFPPKNNQLLLLKMHPNKRQQANPSLPLSLCEAKTALGSTPATAAKRENEATWPARSKNQIFIKIKNYSLIFFL